MSNTRLRFAHSIGDEYRWFAWYPVNTLDRGWKWMTPVWKRRYEKDINLPGKSEKFFVYTYQQGILS